MFSTAVKLTRRLTNPKSRETLERHRRKNQNHLGIRYNKGLLKLQKSSNQIRKKRDKVHSARCKRWCKAARIL